MGSDSSTGGWKDGLGGHVRINSDPVQPTTSKGDDDDVELADHPSPRALDFPRLGVDALIHDGRPERTNEDGSFAFYKVYKRRWFGLVQLTLLNIIVSWDVSYYT